MKPFTKTLLVDADIVAFQAAARNETWTDFGRDVGELWVAHADMDSMIRRWLKMFKADTAVMALSCREHNFRKDVLPTYKDNRKGSEDRRPDLLTDCKAYLAEAYESVLWYGLEGDDVLGILHTHPSRAYGETIVISEDKDLRTVEGLLYAPHRDEVGLIDITKLEADQFLCWQTLVGDSTDGYGGCKGIGKASPYALEVLEADADELWDIVVEGYASKGFTEEDAIVQIRCAKILTAEHYDTETKEIHLWTPADLLT